MAQVRSKPLRPAVRKVATGGRPQHDGNVRQQGHVTAELGSTDTATVGEEGQVNTFVRSVHGWRLVLVLDYTVTHALCSLRVLVYRFFFKKTTGLDTDRVLFFKRVFERELCRFLV